MTEETFDQWAIVELLGRHVIAGRVTEQTIAGAGFVRVDVPDIPNPGNPAQYAGGFTKLFGPSAIYGITPMDEATARRAAERLAVRPIAQWVMPDPSLQIGITRPDVESDFDPEYGEGESDDEDLDDPPLF